MSTTQIDLDQDLLDKAADILGTTTKKPPSTRRCGASSMLRPGVVTSMSLLQDALPDLDNPEIMQAAWR